MLANEFYSIRYLRPTDQSCWQLLLVGVHARPARSLRLGSFIVLLECNKGHLHWFAIRSRSFPDQNQLSAIANILSENTSIHPNQNVTLLEDRIGDEIGLSVKFLEGDLENPAAWRFGDVVAEAMIVAIGAGVRMNTIDCLRDLENAWREKFATFLSQLNQEILAVARSLGGLNVKRYNFFANPDLRVATYRRQAAMAMPLLVQQLCDNIDQSMAPLLDAIDEGKPLFKLLANRLQVQPSVLKTLAGVRPDWLSKQRTNRIAALARLVSDIDANFRPRTEEDWRKFSNALDTLAVLAKRSFRVASSRIWIRHIAQNGFALPEALSENIDAHSRMIDQFVDALTSAVIYELENQKADHLQEEAITALNRYYLKQLGLDRLLEICRRYGGALRQAQRSCAAEIQTMTSRIWPSIIARPFQSDDLFIVPLLTPEELVEEGRVMNNCIETYQTACAQGRCQLFSIRDQNHQRQSCVETTLHQALAGRFELRVVQHRAYGNTRPEHKESRAIEALVKHVEVGGTDIMGYWAWKTKVAVLNMEQRRAKARMLPILRALEAVLPTRYAFDRLVESIICGKRGYGNTVQIRDKS